MTRRIAIRDCTRMMPYAWRNLMKFANDFLSSENNDVVTKWLASAGLVGTNVAGQVGTCYGVGLYIFNYNYALVYRFLLAGLCTPDHSRTCTRTHARSRTYIVSINICDFTGYEPVKRTHLTLSLVLPTYPVHCPNLPR